MRQKVVNENFDWDVTTAITNFDIACQNIGNASHEAIEELSKALASCHWFCSKRRHDKEKVRQVWSHVCEKYPYDNVDLNVELTSKFRGSWNGRALLFSLFCNEVIEYNDNHFRALNGYEYPFRNDAWIGTLGAPPNPMLPFVVNPGVSHCRCLLLYAPEQAQFMTDAATAIVNIYEKCQSGPQSSELWNTFLLLYSSVANFVDSTLKYAVYKVSKQHDCPEVYYDMFDTNIKHPDELMNRYISPDGYWMQTLFGQFNQQLGVFFNNINDLLILR